MTGPAKQIGLLWDESHFWGVMLERALHALGFRPRILHTGEIAHSGLQQEPLTVLLVPGGWASRKAKALGSRGRTAIQEYVENGGVYFGLCGGAGLALDCGSEGNGLALCPWVRKPMQARLPNCSGHLRLRLNERSGACPEGTSRIAAPVWWPSQFEPDHFSEHTVLAWYESPERDFWVADLPAGHLDQELLLGWEEVYGINLDPELLRGEPAVIASSLGRGAYLLSYVHLESPGSQAANAWFCRLLSSYGLGSPGTHQGAAVPEWDLRNAEAAWEDPVLEDGLQALLEVVCRGEENFLLCWRKPWLLGWRRGIPGFALNTLLALLTEARELGPAPKAESYWRERRESFAAGIQRFKSLFVDYMLRERLVLAKSVSSPEQSGSAELQRLKERITGPFPGQGGIFRELVQTLEELLRLQLRSREDIL